MKNKDSLDCQSKRLENSFKLTRVGITGVKKPIVVHRNGREVHVTADIDVFVDVPSTQRGSHMSRNVEVVSEMIDLSVRRKVTGLEQLSGKNLRRRRADRGHAHRVDGLRPGGRWADPAA